MFSILLLVTVALLGSLASTTATAMTGDMFVFAYSWQPEFCYNQASYKGCAQPQDYWKSYFTIHGLWPEYSTGGYPQTCTKEPFNATVADEIGWSTMTTYWPNVKTLESDPSYPSFWEHEWTKHGTCTGLTQLQYFQETIDLLKKTGTPASITANVGGNLTAAALRNDFGGADRVALQCNGGAYLVGAYTCWSQANGVPVEPVVCPKDVLKGDTCTKSYVVIQAFPEKAQQ